MVGSSSHCMLEGWRCTSFRGTYRASNNCTSMLWIHEKSLLLMHRFSLLTSRPLQTTQKNWSICFDPNELSRSYVSLTRKSQLIIFALLSSSQPFVFKNKKIRLYEDQSTLHGPLRARFTMESEIWTEYLLEECVLFAILVQLVINKNGECGWSTRNRHYKIKN